MENDVTSSSYLDEDDPFGTLARKAAKLAQPDIGAILHDGEKSDDGELSDDSLDAPLEKKWEGEGKIESARGMCSIWSSSFHEEERRDFEVWSSNSPAPSESGSLRSDGGGCERFVPQQQPQKMPPYVMRSQTNMLLNANRTQLHSVPDVELRQMVKSAAHLIHEHDNLISTRQELMKTMSDMHDKERETALSLLKSMEESCPDEATQNIITEMSGRVHALARRNCEYRRDTENISPPCLGASGCSPVDGVPSMPPLPPYAMIPPPPINFSLPPPVPPKNALGMAPMVAPPDLSRPPPILKKSNSTGGPFGFPPPPPFPSLLHKPPPPFHPGRSPMFANTCVPPPMRRQMSSFRPSPNCFRRPPALPVVFSPVTPGDELAHARKRRQEDPTSRPPLVRFPAPETKPRPLSEVKSEMNLHTE